MGRTMNGKAKILARDSGHTIFNRQAQAIVREHRPLCFFHRDQSPAAAQPARH